MTVDWLRRREIAIELDLQFCIRDAERSAAVDPSVMRGPACNIKCELAAPAGEHGVGIQGLRGLTIKDKVAVFIVDAEDVPRRGPPLDDDRLDLRTHSDAVFHVRAYGRR
jgi:hypothetical protein